MNVHKMNAYWRAANYLSVGQIYLLDNPLLKMPLKMEHIKPRLLGHWGTTPGINLIYVHLNRLIKEKKLNMICVTGPGHGGPAIVANTYLEKTLTELYPKLTQNEEGMRLLFKQFSFPGGFPSHVAAQVPGSINEGGELGYSLAHAYGAVFDNPDLIAACIIGDGEAETGTLATSWHSNKFLNPARDGAVLPILHLNGYKISGPTVLGRISLSEIFKLLEGYGYKPLLVRGNEPFKVHKELASALDRAISEISAIQKEARKNGFQSRPIWPMIILATPKGWTCPKIVDGKRIEGTFRSHQVPITQFPEHIPILEKWMKSYRPDELFDEKGAFRKEFQSLAPHGNKRMGANPHANGGLLLQELKLPDFRKYALRIDAPGKTMSESTRVLGGFIRDIIKNNPKNFRLFGPDETDSNRLSAVFEVTDRETTAVILKTDENLAPDGRVMEVLSENLCQGWLEGYLLTGRHGFFSCYEAFIHIVDSMFNQFAKWLKVCNETSWRKPVASLNYLLTSHVWRQDHNGFSHQDPGFIDHVINKKAAIVRVYFPPDANTLLSVADHCFKSRNYVNVIVAGKQPEYQWLNMDDAIKHCEQGLSIWKWASSDKDNDPDVVMACVGDVPTIEVLAASLILKQYLPKLKVRVINIVDLMTLQPQSEHPHGLSDEEYDAFFTQMKPIIFNFHGYPWLIHRLTYRRNNQRLHVRGYKEEGTTTTPFDMCVLNEIDRFHLVRDVIKRVGLKSAEAMALKQVMEDRLKEHKAYIQQYGQDMPEIRNWKWHK